MKLIEKPHDARDSKNRHSYRQWSLYTALYVYFDIINRQ